MTSTVSPYSNVLKQCRRNGKQYGPWSDCSWRKNLIGVCTVCSGISVPKLRTLQYVWFVWEDTKDNGATSWENLFMPYANNKDADQPAHPCSLISIFVVRCLDSISLVSIVAISCLYLASVAEQTGLSLTCWKIPKIGFLVTRLFSWRGSTYSGCFFTFHVSPAACRIFKVAPL